MSVSVNAAPVESVPSRAIRPIEVLLRAFLFAVFAFYPMSGALRGGALPKLVVAAIIGAAAWDLVARWGRIRLGATEVVVLAFGMWYVLAIAATPWPMLASGTMVTVVGWTVVVAALAQLLCNGRRVLAAFTGYVAGCAGVGCWALVNVATGAFSTAQIPGQDVNDTGFYTATGAVAAIALWASRGMPIVLVRLYALAAVLLVPAVAASLSRGSLLGLVVGCVVIVMTNPYARPTLLKGAALLTVLAAVSFPLWLPRVLAGARLKSHVAGENVSSRLDAWVLGANLGVEHPIAGVGPATIAPHLLEAEKPPPDAFVVGVAHNTLIEALYGTGVVGLAILAAAVVAAGWAATRTASRSGGRAIMDGAVGAPGVAVLAAGIACAMFTTQLFNPTMWLVIVLAAAGSARPLPPLADLLGPGRRRRVPR